MGVALRDPLEEPCSYALFPLFKLCSKFRRLGSSELSSCSIGDPRPLPVVEVFGPSPILPELIVELLDLLSQALSYSSSSFGELMIFWLTMVGLETNKGSMGLSTVCSFGGTLSSLELAEAAPW